MTIYANVIFMQDERKYYWNITTAPVNHNVLTGL